MLAMKERLVSKVQQYKEKRKQSVEGGLSDDQKEFNDSRMSRFRADNTSST